MPAVLYKKLTSRYHISAGDLLNRIYGQPFANLFVASFSEFLSQNIHHEYCYDLVKESFTAFFEDLVSHYPNYRSCTFNCISSVRYNFRSILAETACEFGMVQGTFASSPMDGLINYHLKNFTPFISTYGGSY